MERFFPDKPRLFEPIVSIVSTVCDLASILAIGTNVVQSEYAKAILFSQLFMDKAVEKKQDCL